MKAKWPLLTHYWALKNLTRIQAAQFNISPRTAELYEHSKTVGTSKRDKNKANTNAPCCGGKTHSRSQKTKACVASVGHTEESSDVKKLRQLDGTSLGYSLSEDGPTVDTPFGKVPVGSLLSYQTRNFTNIEASVGTGCGNTLFPKTAPVKLTVSTAIMAYSRLILLLMVTFCLIVKSSCRSNFASSSPRRLRRVNNRAGESNKFRLLRDRQDFLSVAFLCW
ncbi:uncharacterized protein LOC121377010 isoform X2 [Gigantopelta aegis]|uniref:uncharacterized protein LOC121377010 isoform X2 n=1 Tax=Gigantopelta aegis TaxID=1735272 RepID=UPI001B888FC7|nr:uncharacterized protein LOC121377010 isoform X2 [Gigantopelta aegis]